MKGLGKLFYTIIQFFFLIQLLGGAFGALEWNEHLTRICLGLLFLMILSLEGDKDDRG